MAGWPGGANITLSELKYQSLVLGGYRGRGRPRGGGGANITLSELKYQSSVLGGQGGSQEPRISHLVSRHVKTFRFKLYVAINKVVGSAFGTPKRWPLAGLEGWPLVRGKYRENIVRAS